MHCMVHQLILIENIYKKCSLYLEKLGFKMLDCVELFFFFLWEIWKDFIPIKEVQTSQEAC